MGPFAAFCGCTLIWSSTFLAIRIGNDSLPPVWSATLRLALASVLLTAIALGTRQAWPRGGALRAAVAFGVVDFGISLPLLYWGEKSVPSSLAAILFATIPLSTAAFAWITGLERIRPVRLAAALVGLAGVALLFSTGLRGAAFLPLLAVFLSSVAASLAGVLLKRAPGTSPVATNAIAHAAGAPLCLIASLAMGEPRTLPATAAAWYPLLYLVLVGSITAFVLFAWLVQKWSVVRISFISVLTPVLATVLGGLVLHERLGPTALAGALVVLLGVALALRSEGGAGRAESR